MTTAEQGAEHVQHMLGAYVLSALSADEDLAVSRHLADCATCANEAATLDDVLRVLDRLDGDGVARLLAAVSQAPGEPDVEAGPTSTPTTPDATTPAPTTPASTTPASTSPVRPSSPPAGPSGSRPASPGRDRRPPAGRRWSRPYRMVLAAFAVTLAVGIGIGGWLASRDPVGIQLAGTETNVQSGVSVSVTVVGTAGGSRIDAQIEGLTIGRAYQLFAVGDRGESQVAASWTAQDHTQGVGGEVSIPVERLTTVTLTRADGSVLVTVRLTER